MDCPVTKFPHLTTLETSKNIEYRTPVTGVTTGEIPKWLNGSWYRNGPGIIHFKNESVNHWFDGMALARRFHFENGKLTYISRLVEGESLEKNTKAGKVAVAEFGTYVQHNEGFLGKVKNMLTMPEFTDNCLINFLRLGDHLFTITESNFIRKINPETLDTEEKVNLSEYLPINIMSSHPLVDIDGSIYTFSSSIFNMGRTKYNLLKFPCGKKGASLETVLSGSKHLCSIDSSWRISPSYYHSFALSENYAVFVEMPLKIDIPKMSVAHLRQMSHSECMELLPDTQTRIYLVHKKTGKQHPVTYKTDPLIVYHHINAYEEDNHVVLDLCCYKTNSFYDKFTIKNLTLSPNEFVNKFSSDEFQVCATRIVLPLAEDLSVAEGSETNLVTLEDTGCKASVIKQNRIFCQSEVIVKGVEAPVINNKYLGKKYKYFYSPGGLVLPPGEMLMKIDIESKSTVHTWKEAGCWVSQPAFVERPDSRSEDDVGARRITNIAKKYMLGKITQLEDKEGDYEASYMRNKRKIDEFFP